VEILPTCQQKRDVHVPKLYYQLSALNAQGESQQTRFGNHADKAVPCTTKMGSEMDIACSLETWFGVKDRLGVQQREAFPAASPSKALTFCVSPPLSWWHRRSQVSPTWGRFSSHRAFPFHRPGTPPSLRSTALPSCRHSHPSEALNTCFYSYC